MISPFLFCLLDVLECAQVSKVRLLFHFIFRVFILGGRAEPSSRAWLSEFTYVSSAIPDTEELGAAECPARIKRPVLDPILCPMPKQTDKSFDQHGERTGKIRIYVDGKILFSLYLLRTECKVLGDPFSYGVSTAVKETDHEHKTAWENNLEGLVTTASPEHLQIRHRI